MLSNVHVYFFTGTITHMHERVPKKVLRARSLVYEEL